MMNKIKIAAINLPQFHEVKENNVWWGEGFTEWNHVKNMKNYYKGHKKIIPLNDNYYDLLEKETLVWQTKLMEEYGVDIMCYYHYWFSGKKILEKPVENLLKWKDINQEFCFYWANHTWRRTWEGNREVLMLQDYGDQDEWESHFLYLLSFFKDDRYTKIHNSPVLVIYNAKEITDFDDRIKYYNKRAREESFSGIHIIETVTNLKEKKVSKESKGILLREPNISLTTRNYFEKIMYRVKRKNRKVLKKPYRIDYQKITDKSFKKISKLKDKNNIYFSVFTSWDSTPRHGNRGYIIENSTPKLFEKTLDNIMKITTESLIFINAWNEWGEGMYLEPDKENSYGYLESIKNVKEKGR